MSSLRDCTAARPGSRDLLAHAWKPDADFVREVTAAMPHNSGGAGAQWPLHLPETPLTDVLEMDAWRQCAEAAWGHWTPEALEQQWAAGRRRGRGRGGGRGRGEAVAPAAEPNPAQPAGPPAPVVADAPPAAVAPAQPPMEADAPPAAPVPAAPIEPARSASAAAG